jgi:hypothetical protein
MFLHKFYKIVSELFLENELWDKCLEESAIKKMLTIFKLYLSHPFCKKGLGLVQKHSWPSSKMAAKLSFRFTYGLMCHAGYHFVDHHVDRLIILEILHCFKRLV